jgi:hypothetical protein
MDNYTFDSFLEDLKSWYRNHTNEYFNFIGILNEDEKRKTYLFFELMIQFANRIPWLVKMDDVKIPQEMADIIKRSHTIDRMVKSMGYLETEYFVMSYLYWIYYDNSFEWAAKKLRNPIPGGHLGFLKWPLEWLSNKVIIERSIRLGMRTKGSWKLFWNLEDEMNFHPIDELVLMLPEDERLTEKSIEDKSCDDTDIQTNATPNKNDKGQYVKLSELVNIKDEESKKKIINRIKERLLVKSTAYDLFLILISLKQIVIPPSTSAILPVKLALTRYREALALEYSDIEIVDVSGIQKANRTFANPWSNGRMLIDSTEFRLEIQKIKDFLLK